MNVVAGAVDEGRHLGVPAMRLVAEVHASFQKLTHIERGKRHGQSFSGWSTADPDKMETWVSGPSTGALSGAFNPPSARSACEMGVLIEC